MGTNCSLMLPNTARLNDVADVMGLLLGKKGQLLPLSKDSSYLKVDGVKVNMFKSSLNFPAN